MRDERGQATVEIALAMPVVIVVLAALVEIGFVVSDQVRLWHAAREAARVAVVDPDGGAITEAARRTGFEALDVSVDPAVPFRRQGAPLTVTVAYDRPGSMPFIGGVIGARELSAEATMRIEVP
jgi:Flp pilus assembly protein TadG